MVWRFLIDSVQGTSHIRSGTGCQDSSFASVLQHDGQEYLLVACADGAGTAKASDVGAKVACTEAVRLAAEFLRGCSPPRTADREVLLGWARAVHEGLVHEAERQQVGPRDLACTLLLAVVGRADAAFLQVGDGAIVIKDQSGRYVPVFWPQTGEYHNATYFVTDESYEQNIQTSVMGEAPAELALFTDGLQMLALDYNLRAAHAPFFAPLFRALRAAEDHAELGVPMRQFLDSDAVNARTDDDKTLALAVRVSTCDHGDENSTDGCGHVV